MVPSNWKDKKDSVIVGLIHRYIISPFMRIHLTLPKALQHILPHQRPPNRLTGTEIWPNLDLRIELQNVRTNDWVVLRWIDVESFLNSLFLVGEDR